MQLTLRSLLALFAVAFSSLAQTKTLTDDIPSLQIEKHTLSNGLQLMLHVDRKLPMVNVNMWFHVGSRDERVGRSGFAHLFEHMMFEGSKNAPEKYFKYAEKMGANVFQGGVNGTTSWDRTNYFITVPSANLEHVLWLESDRLATLAEAVTKEKLDNQRDVVRNERRQGLENQPYGRWVKLVFENVLPYRHPYANDVIGSHQDLIAATVDDVKEFFRTYYTPNNLSLAIVGDFDPVEAKKLVEKYFGGIPPGPALDRPARWIPQLQQERIVEVRDRVPQERTYFAWPGPAFFEQGDAELQLASTVLTDGLASRLQRVLVYDNRIATTVDSFFESAEGIGVFVVIATARPGASLSDIEKVVKAEISRLAREGPTAHELTRAKNKWEARFITGLERIGGFGGKADRLNAYNTYLGDPEKFEADILRFRNATQASVRDSVAKWLDAEGRLMVRFRPEASSKALEVSLDRSKQPPLGTDKLFVPPPVQTSKLDNGLEVLVIERRDLPKVGVALVTRAGAMDDTAAKAGLADLTVNMMRMGTNTRNALELEEAMADLGTSLFSRGQREASTIGFDVVRRNLKPALKVFADVVLNPSFSDSELDLQKKRRLDALAQQSSNPYAIAVRIAPMLSYGSEHPYGTPVTGLPKTVEKLTRADLAGFYERYWKPGSSALIFAGDLSMNEAVSMAKEAFGSWPGGSRPALTIATPRPLGKGRTYVVHRPDAPQTMVVQLVDAPARASEDYFPLRLADAVWGGAVGARLNSNIREQKGYSYGVFSSTDLHSKAGLWRSGGTVQTDKTRESLVEFNKELLFLSGEKPVTEEELAGAKANRIRSYAQQFESLSRVAEQAAALWTVGLPLTELQREPAELQKSALSAVNAVATKYVRPSDAITLLVGDLSKIEPGVREVMKGDIVTLDVEGNVISK